MSLILPDGADVRDPQVFGEVFRQTHGRILGFVMVRVGCRTVAEDLTSETFYKAWRAIDRFDPERAPIEAWLFGIATNTVGDWLRWRRVRRFDSEIPGDAMPGAVADSLAQLEFERVEQAVDAAKVAARVTPRLDALAATHRQVMVLRYVLGRTAEQTARTLGVPVSTVKSRTWQARTRLRASLGVA